MQEQEEEDKEEEEGKEEKEEGEADGEEDGKEEEDGVVVDPMLEDFEERLEEFAAPDSDKIGTICIDLDEAFDDDDAFE